MSSSKRIIVYYSDWCIYDRKYLPNDVPFDKVTHIQFCFLKPKPDGSIEFADPWADWQIKYQQYGDSWNEPADVANGILKQFFLAKQKNRNLKIILSIGGWTLSSPFYDLAASETTRTKFANECVRVVREVGADGIDIDWEFVGGGGNDAGKGSTADAKNFELLLKAIREAFDATDEAKKGIHFEITIAAPGEATKIAALAPQNIYKYLDVIQIMAYDFEGSWSPTVGHLANLYGSSGSLNCSGDSGVQKYLDLGVPANKIVLGVPYMGRAFANVASSSGYGTTYSGNGKGTWEAGCYDYKTLPIGQEYVDLDRVAAYCYDPSQKLWISYDNPQTMKLKADYVNKKGLAGLMAWVIDADSTKPERSLTNVIFNSFNGNLEKRNNNLYYPLSKYSNINNIPFDMSDISNVVPFPVVPSPVVPSPVVPSPVVPGTGTTGGTWSVNKKYNVGDIVYKNNIKYVCSQANTAVIENNPKGASYWNVVSQVPVVPVPVPVIPVPVVPVPVGTQNWAFGQSYIIGSIVSYNGKPYKCITAHTVIDPGWTPLIPSLWTPI